MNNWSDQEHNGNEQQCHSYSHQCRTKFYKIYTSLIQETGTFSRKCPMEIIETRRQCWAIAEENIFYSIIIIFRGGGGGVDWSVFCSIYEISPAKIVLCEKKYESHIGSTKIRQCFSVKDNYKCF